MGSQAGDKVSLFKFNFYDVDNEKGANETGRSDYQGLVPFVGRNCPLVFPCPRVVCYTSYLYLDTAAKLYG